MWLFCPWHWWDIFMCCWYVARRQTSVPDIVWIHGTLMTGEISYALWVWSRNVDYWKSIHIIPSAREFVRLLPNVMSFALSFAEYEFVILCFVGVIYLSNFTAWLVLWFEPEISCEDCVLSLVDGDFFVNLFRQLLWISNTLKVESSGM